MEQYIANPIYDSVFLNVSNCHIESDDTEMQRIVRRLASAASNPEIRHTMDIEDEIFSELESLDTTVLMQKKTIVEQGEQIAQKNEQIATLVKLMLAQKTPEEMIANALNIQIEDIHKYLGRQ